MPKIFSNLKKTAKKASKSISQTQQVISAIPTPSDIGKVVSNIPTSIKAGVQDIGQLVNSARNIVRLGKQGKLLLEDYFGANTFEARTDWLQDGNSFIRAEGAPSEVELNRVLREANTVLHSKTFKTNASVQQQEIRSITGELEDFVTFRFRDLINEELMDFYATLSNINQTISPDWSEEKYIGRPEKIYTYQGTDRSISFDFKIVAKNVYEIKLQHRKLEYLASLCYPSLNKAQRMQGPIIELTIGDYFKEVPGFLESLSFTIGDTSPWEVESGYQYPHYIEVSCGFKYIGTEKLVNKFSIELSPEDEKAILESGANVKAADIKRVSQDLPDTLNTIPPKSNKLKIF